MLRQDNCTVTDNSVIVARLNMIGTIVAAIVLATATITAALFSSKDKPPANNIYVTFKMDDTTKIIKLENMRSVSLKVSIDAVIATSLFIPFK